MKLNLIFMFIIPGCILPAYAQSPVGIPGKPSIENIQFDIVYDYDHKYPQPKYSLFSFDVTYHNTERIYLYTNCSKQYHVSEKPRFFDTILENKETDNSESGIIHLEVPDTDWGECFAVRCLNKYGAIMSDTLNTTNYITDIDLLNYINDYWDKQTGLNDIKQDSDAITFENGNIVCSPAIQSLSIYSLHGIAIRQFIRPEIIETEDIPKGLYIITYTTNSQKFKSIKYLKP